MIIFFMEENVKYENEDNKNKLNESKNEPVEDPNKKPELKKINHNGTEEIINVNKEPLPNVKNDLSSTQTTVVKPKKEIPIEKKPFEEFINSHLIPTLVEEIKKKGFEISSISLENTSRPIAEDKCWVIFCEIKNTCNFWLSFENDDIGSLKSISLSKPNQKPSILESFLIDEKRITLKLIVSRILQRLNGQKLFGYN